MSRSNVFPRLTHECFPRDSEEYNKFNIQIHSGTLYHRVSRSVMKIGSLQSPGNKKKKCRYVLSCEHINTFQSRFCRGAGVHPSDLREVFNKETEPKANRLQGATKVQPSKYVI